MEVLNKQERVKAFWLFFAVFSITIVIIVFAIFFNFQLPKEENEHLRTENDLLKKEFEFQQQFSYKIDSAKQYIDSINAPGQDNFFQEQIALKKLAEMYSILPKDTLKGKKMYSNVILTYKQLIDSKKQIRNLTYNEKTMDSLAQIAQTFQEEYEKMKLDLEVCRQLYQGQ
ncbi:type VI secretion system TssO [uncultured Flavobacterium sp.]|uniref:type VI secretion system TssO n=1 Tax=uncultured Flavobacterium sp. TaxID=165435 RepID=UPI0025F6F3DA|nr:type VI secretion system TssO [uncultured Flavobacterium sp.]